MPGFESASYAGFPASGENARLDVGCATGDFLVAAMPRVHEAVGVELSDYAARRAVDRGVDVVLAGDFLTVDVPGAGFEVVTMWDFIEHVPDAGAALRRAFSLLRPGGYLVLSTGDVESFVARRMGRFWHLLIPPKHLYFFSERTISRLLTSAGFAPATVRRAGKRVPLDWALAKVFSIAAPAAGRAVRRLAGHLGLGGFSRHVNLFDTMTVVASREA